LAIDIELQLFKFHFLRAKNSASQSEKRWYLHKRANFEHFAGPFFYIGLIFETRLQHLARKATETEREATLSVSEATRRHKSVDLNRLTDSWRRHKGKLCYWKLKKSNGLMGWGLDLEGVEAHIHICMPRTEELLCSVTVSVRSAN